MKQQDFDFMDDMARNALENWESPFNPDDWKAMEARLNRKEHRRPKIWLFKSIEITVIALAIFGLFTVTNHSANTNFTAQSGNTVAQTTDLGINTLDNTNSQSQKNAKTNEHGHLQSVLATKSQGLKGNAAGENKVFQLREQKAGSTLLGGKSLSAKKQNPAGMGDVALGLPLGLSLAGSAKGKNKAGFVANGLGGNHKNNHPTATTSAADLQANLFENQQASSLEAANDVANGINNNNNNPIADNSIMDVNRQILTLVELPLLNNTDGNIGDEPLFELKRLKNKDAYQRRLRLGLQLSADANIDCAYGNSHLGYSGGWTMEAEFSYMFSVQSGMTISQKNYRSQRDFAVTSPDGENKTYNVREESVTRLTLMQIPLQVQGSFFRNKHWRIGMSVGAMANFIVAKSFVGMQRVEHDGLILHNQINPNDYERGWWQGAKLANNLYWSVGGGALVERSLTDRWSLLVQPQYYHSLSPNANKAGFKLGSFSMTVGIRGAF